jgi:probable F420-dependent oxidoreductase
MRDYRFGFNLHGARPLAEFREHCREGEDFGYDVVLVPDHLGKDCLSPFATMVAAAEATERMRVGSFVLNIGFWNPSVLARDAATTDLLTDGRLELGLGTGYMKSEFDDADIPWQPYGERVTRLERTLDELDRLWSPDAPKGYRTAQKPRPPLMIAGGGDRILTLAAKRADIVAHTAAAADKSERTGLRALNSDEFAKRVRFFQDQAGDRVAEIEANLLIQMVRVTDTARATTEKIIAERGLKYDADELLNLPAVLIGTVDQIAEKVESHRERYGITYFCVHDAQMRAFGPVIEKLRG